MLLTLLLILDLLLCRQRLLKLLLADLVLLNLPLLASLLGLLPGIRWRLQWDHSRQNRS